MRPVLRGCGGAGGVSARAALGPAGATRRSLPPSTRCSAHVLSACCSRVHLGWAWVPLSRGSAGRDVQTEGRAQGQFGETAALPSCWVCSCVVLPICLYVSTAFLSFVEEPRKPGCWPLVLDAGRVSGGLRRGTVGSLSSDWPFLLSPGLALSPWGTGSCQSELSQAPSGDPLVCHCSLQPPVLSWLKPDCAAQSLWPCSRDSPRTQSPCPSPGPRGCPFGLLPCRPLHPGTCPQELCVLDWGRRSPGGGDVPSRNFPLQLRGWELVHCSVWGQVSGSQGPVDTSLGSSCLLRCHHGRCVHLVTGGSTTKGARSTVAGCRHQAWSWSC